MPNVNPDIRIHWAGAIEVPEDEKWAKSGCNENKYSGEKILRELGSNTLSIAKLTDRLILAKQMDEEGHTSKENTKLIEVVSEDLDTLYSDRECLYRIDAMRDLLHPDMPSDV